MNIRKAQKEDVNDLTILYKMVFSVHNIFTKSDEVIIRYLVSKLDKMLVAEEESKVVAALVIFEKNYGDWKVTNFKHVGVLPEYQGEGIGSTLLREAENSVKFGKIEIRVADTENLIEFYEKNGYEKEAELKSHYRKGETCFVMGKIL